MPEYRQDPLSAHWVIIAKDRARRPNEFESEPRRRQVERCPFCAGNEDETPESLAVYGTPAAAHPVRGWQVRVIPNKYPAVIDAALVPPPCLPFHPAEAGRGAHELVIESPHHTSSFTELTAEQARLSWVAYRDRLAYLANQQRYRYGLVFKNCGPDAGATLDHTHSQIIAVNRIPMTVAQELRAAGDYHARHLECIFCAMARQELDESRRIVATTSRFIAWCPYASRFAYETWIVPRMHAERFELAKMEDLEELSRLFQSVLRGLEQIVPQVPYNYWIHTAPFDIPCHDHYHWHIELVPRLNRIAGFELGSGCYVNPVDPEDAASALRAAIARTGHCESNH